MWLQRLHSHKKLSFASNCVLVGFLFFSEVNRRKPSLVCDFIEIYRNLIDDFLIKCCRTLRSKDFVMKTENLERKKRGKREHLNYQKTKDLMKKSNIFFESTIEIPRIRVGKKQTLETLINEETLLFAKYLR